MVNAGILARIIHSNKELYMSILDKLTQKEVWLEFLEHKKRSDFFSKADEKSLAEYIENEEYLPFCEKILSGKDFPLPSLTKINKKFSEKKRMVFVYDYKDKLVFKLLAYLLYKYDYLFEDNLFSFRRKINVRMALYSLLKQNKDNTMYSYKVDIHDYFNSCDTDTMMKVLRENIKDDDRLIDFIETILREPRAIFNGETVEVKKGIMAGVPISGFLANLYLRHLDKWFSDRNIPYARYSDDIIVFAESKEKIEEYEGVIKAQLSDMHLEVNERKEVRTVPNENWEFLGFLISDDNIDISPVTLEKMKAKMKRKARALIRWYKRNKYNPTFAVRAYIKHFNRKFYCNTQDNELTWALWYFPTITTPDSLHIIDEYSVSCMRFIATGKYTKANYNLRYKRLKQLGHKSLVNSFYKFKEKSPDTVITTKDSIN